MTINDLYVWGKNNDALNLPIEIITEDMGEATIAYKVKSTTNGQMKVQLK